MDTQEFYDEMDRLIKQGETTFPKYNLDLEAFQYIEAIRRKSNRQKRFSYLVGVFFLLLVAAAVFLYLNPTVVSGNLAGNKSNSNEAELERMVETLSSQNQDLRVTVTNLESKLEQYQDKEKTNGEETASSVTTEKPKTETKPGSEVKIHVVAKGETLYSIAKQYYGSGKKFKQIMEDNQIKDAGELKEGMSLKIYPEK